MAKKDAAISFITVRPSVFAMTKLRHAYDSRFKFGLEYDGQPRPLYRIPNAKSGSVSLLQLDTIKYDDLGW